MSICTSMGVQRMSVANRHETIEAIIKMQSYLGGYSAAQYSTAYFIRTYYSVFSKSVLNDPIRLLSLFTTSVTNRENYIDMILDKFPTYLHSLYRYATRVLGTMASAKSLADLMNRRSATLHPNCPIRSNLNLSQYHFWRFFISFMESLLIIQLNQD